MALDDEAEENATPMDTESGCTLCGAFSAVSTLLGLVAAAPAPPIQQPDESRTRRSRTPTAHYDPGSFVTAARSKTDKLLSKLRLGRRRQMTVFKVPLEFPRSLASPRIIRTAWDASLWDSPEKTTA